MGLCGRQKVSRCIVALTAVSLFALVSCAGPSSGPQATSTTNSSPATSAPTTTSPPPQASGYSLPGCYYPSPDPRTPGADRPATVVLQGCMSSGLWLEDMSWTSWGAEGADGSGTAAVNTCTPNCASGEGIKKNPVVVHASNPQPAAQKALCPAGVKFYTDLFLAFPKDLPPSDYMQTNAQYEGMPAAHYSDQQPICS